MMSINDLINDARLAIPKDDLFNVAIRMLESKGIKLYHPLNKKKLSGDERRRYELPIVAYLDTELSSSPIPILTAPDIAQYILDGTLDIGVTGFDVCMELSKMDLEGLLASLKDNLSVERIGNKDIGKFMEGYEELMRQYLTRAGFEPIINLDYPISYLVIAFKNESGLRKITDLQNITNPTIATEFLHILDEYLKLNNLQGDVKSHLTYGSTEAFVKGNLSTACLDITATGKTLRQYGLIPAELVLISTPWLIANPQYKCTEIKTIFLHNR